MEQVFWKSVESKLVVKEQFVSDSVSVGVLVNGAKDEVKSISNVISKN